IVGTRASGEERLSRPIRTSPLEALGFGVELTSLKSLHRLCDGRRTLFLVDQQGKLAELIDIRRWVMDRSPEIRLASDECGATADEPLLSVPCARLFRFHALATRDTDDVCMVLTPNQEIKVFAAGVQAFVFAHGRWRVLDPESKFSLWRKAVVNPRL